MNNDTPRTDAALIDCADLYDWGYGKSDMVREDFARELERENARLREALELIRDASDHPWSADTAERALSDASSA